MKLRVIHGAPCSGKTTYVREHIGENDIVYDYDEIARALTYGTTQSAERTQAHAYVMGIRTLILNRLKDEKEIASAWFITTALTDKFREYVSEMSPEYIEIETSIDECLSRLESDDSRPDKQAWREIIAQWFEERENKEERSSMDKKNLVERRFEFETRALDMEGEVESKELWVEGYAVRFNSVTDLFEMDGLTYHEQVSEHSFNGTKMDDVIFNYNHGGRVMARTRNKTLQLSVDDVGLLVRARLDGTDEGRSLYNDIQNGYIDRMSFRFTVGAEEYDIDSRTWTITAVKRLYDVSAVDIPAYEDTLIEARKADAEAVARQRQHKMDIELLRKRTELALKLSEGE